MGQPTCKYRGRFLRKLRQFSRIFKYVAHNLDFLTSFFSVYFTLYCPQSGPRTIWVFGRFFKCQFTLCSPWSGLCTLWEFLADFSNVCFILCSRRSRPRPCTIWDIFHRSICFAGFAEMVPIRYHKPIWAGLGSSLCISQTRLKS